MKCVVVRLLEGGVRGRWRRWFSFPLIITHACKHQQEGKFSCYFYVDGELNIRLLTPESEWSVVEEAGEWLGRTAGGCRNNPTCAFNPQFLVKVKQQTEITAVLYQGQPARSTQPAPDQVGFYVFKTKGAFRVL